MKTIKKAASRVKKSINKVLPRKATPRKTEVKIPTKKSKKTTLPRTMVGEDPVKHAKDIATHTDEPTSLDRPSQI